MEKEKVVTKIFLYLTALSGIIWIGSYVLRLSLSYQLFEPNEYILKSYYTTEGLNNYLLIYLTAIKTTAILYLIFFTAFFIFIFLTKLKLKKNGWLFIITLIISLTLPFELFLMTIDYQMINLLSSQTFASADVLFLIVKRFKVLNGFPLMEMFAYFSIIYFVIFKPLTVHETNEN